MEFLANQLNFCPFPHRQREFGWLAVGVVLGATTMHYRTKKKYETKITRNFPQTINKVRVVTTDDRVIDEYVGNPSTGNKTISVAMVNVDSKGKGSATEGSQIPLFDEIVVIISEKFQVKYNDGKDMVEAIAGQTLLLPKGIKYEYIFPTGICNYVPICFPAFSPDLIG